MNRTNECFYDDSKRKSRTQVLTEKLLMLQNQVIELEASSQHSASTQDADPISSHGQPAYHLDIHSWLYTGHSSYTSVNIEDGRTSAGSSSRPTGSAGHDKLGQSPASIVASHSLTNNAYALDSSGSFYSSQLSSAPPATHDSHDYLYVTP